jgi:PTS system glucose-specific IIC component
MQDYLKTAGPEADEIEEPSPVKTKTPLPTGLQPPLRDPDAARKASAYIAALGGKLNIVRVDACAQTRLRLVLCDETEIREEALKAAGITDFVKLPDHTLHLLAGLNSDQYAAEMRGQLASSPGAGPSARVTRSDTQALLAAKEDKTASF